FKSPRLPYTFHTPFASRLKFRPPWHSPLQPLVSEALNSLPSAPCLRPPGSRPARARRCASRAALAGVPLVSVPAPGQCAGSVPPSHLRPASGSGSRRPPPPPADPPPADLVCRLLLEKKNFS